MGQGNNDPSWRHNNRKSQLENEIRRSELKQKYKSLNDGEGIDSEQIDAIIRFQNQNITVPTVKRDNGDIAELDFYGFGNREVVSVTGRDRKETTRISVTQLRDPITGAVYDLDGNFIKFDTSEGGSGVLGSEITSLRAKRLAKYGRKRQGGILRYPAESLSQHTDYFQFDIERYVEIGRTNYVSDTGGSTRYVTGNRKTNRAGMTQGAGLSRRPLINDGTILLPIPSNLQDSNNVVYGESKMNGLEAAGVSAATNMVRNMSDRFLLNSQAESNFRDEFKKLGEKIKTGLGGDDRTALVTASDLLTKQLTASAANIFDANVTANQLLARSSGEIINPNLEILFSDVTVRNFRFAYKLTPRNKYESEQVKLIIRAFKRNMAPQAIGDDGAGDFFLRTPNVFKLRYRSGVKDHPFLNKFKQCFLTDMQTTYTGEGVYSTYEDGTPVSILLSLSFKEIQPIYDIDYDEFPGTGAVGY